MERDKRYKSIKIMLEQGHIKKLIDIFEDHLFPITVIAEHLHTSTTRVRKLLNSPGEFTINELSSIADYFDVTHKLIIELAYKTRK